MVGIAFPDDSPKNEHPVSPCIVCVNKSLCHICSDYKHFTTGLILMTPPKITLEH